MVPLQAGAGSARTQSNSDYVASYARYGVTNVSATTEKVSCYRPEVPFFTVGEVRGYTGMTACPGADTGEDIGSTPYPNQAGSVGGYPAPGPMLVNNHSESDLRVDPKNPLHIIGSSKWFASAEGYNHVLGFYESRDGGKTWPVQGHIPGYEGFTDNTDPVGAFDGYGNYYSLILPYQFAYAGGATGTGSKLYQKSKLPNAAMPAEAVTVAVRPAGAKLATDWITTHNGGPDFVLIDDNQGQEPDKQWIAIDANRNSPNFNTIYAMFVTFSFAGKMSDLLHTSGKQVGLGTAQCRSRGARALRPQRVLGIIRIHVAQHFALTREDPDAVEEPRSVTLGLSNLANLLVVVYAYREPDIIRIISAWKANRRQRGQYDKGRS